MAYPTDSRLAWRIRDAFAAAVLIGALAFACGAADAAPRSDSQNLSGTWRFRFDPERVGEASGWYRSETGGEEWTSIAVPASYNEYFPEECWYQGLAWYRTRFASPNADPAGRTILRFLGVALRCKVWVTGREAGAHQSPYTGFDLDVTDLVRGDRPNDLAVAVDNTILPNAIPDDQWDGWWN